MKNMISRVLMGAVVLFAATCASAAVVFPVLELNPVAVTGTASDVTMTGDVPFSLSGPSTILTDFDPDLSFSLTSDTSGIGSLLVDGGSALSASFSNLAVEYVSSGTVTWSADLIYTGGSLAGSLSGGRVEGAFFGVAGSFVNGQSLLGEDFSASSGIAKVGAVVPVPAAVWLFGSGLLGLVGVARRRPAT